MDADRFTGLSPLQWADERENKCNSTVRFVEYHEQSSIFLLFPFLRLNSNEKLSLSVFQIRLLDALQATLSDRFPTNG